MERVYFGRALYYPHIFPQSRQWLRTAALYNDGIGRIVPKRFVPSAYDRHSGPELLRDFEELQAAGFIEDKNPDDILSEVKEEFLEFLTPLLQGPKRKERLRERLGSRDWKPYNMFRDKIARGLIDLLEPKGLIRPVNDYEVEFDASIGGLYMLFLARHMAKHQPIVSDDPMYEALTHVGTQQATTGAPVDRGFLLANARYADEHLETGHQEAGPFVRRRHFGLSGHRRKCGVGASDHESRCAFGNNRYATLFWAEYDGQTHGLKYVNAGHPPPILIHSTGEIERLEPNGLPIGMFRDVQYATTELQIKVGSRLIINFRFGLFLNWLGDQEGHGIEYHLLAIALALVVLVKGAGAFS